MQMLDKEIGSLNPLNKESISRPSLVLSTKLENISQKSQKEMEVPRLRSKVIFSVKKSNKAKISQESFQG